MVLALVELVGISSLEAASCRNVAGYDITLGCVPALAPTTTTYKRLKKLTRCQCNWDTDLNTNADLIDVFNWTDVDTSGGITISNTSATTTVKTTALPSAPVVGSAYRMTASGNVDTSGNFNVQVGIMLGGTTVCNYTMTPLNNSGFSWGIEAVVMQISASPVKFEIFERIIFNTSTPATVSDFKRCGTVGALPTNTIGISEKMQTATINDDFFMDVYLVEQIR